MAATQLQDLEDAEKAYERVKAELEALPVDTLSAMNVDIVSAASIALGVAERILAHRDRMAKLPAFVLSNVSARGIAAQRGSASNVCARLCAEERRARRLQR